MATSFSTIKVKDSRIDRATVSTDRLSIPCQNTLKTVYDQLIASGTHSKEDLLSRRLLRCHPDFRVISLGVPIPPFHGRTLDPPLRSRFQCLVVGMPDPLSMTTTTASSSLSLVPWSRTQTGK